MNQIDDTLNRLVQKGKTPSVQYLLFDQDKILHEYRGGFADVANQKKANEETTYNAFSVTKTFTALAILQLAEKGKIDIDKSAANYMDNFPYSGDITVRHLLTHTAGIPNPNPLSRIHPTNEHQVFDRDAAEGKWQPFKPYYINGASYGGIIGRPVSFMKYAQDLLKKDGMLISPEYKQMLFTENLTLDHKSTSMCLSWFTDQLNDLSYFAHAGGGGGYYCEVRLYPDAGIGSVIMFNRSGMSNEKYLDKLDLIYFKQH